MNNCDIQHHMLDVIDHYSEHDMLPLILEISLYFVHAFRFYLYQDDTELELIDVKIKIFLNIENNKMLFTILDNLTNDLRISSFVQFCFKLRTS